MLACSCPRIHGVKIFFAALRPHLQNVGHAMTGLKSMPRSRSSASYHRTRYPARSHTPSASLPSPLHHLRTKRRYPEQLLHSPGIDPLTNSYPLQPHDPACVDAKKNRTKFHIGSTISSRFDSHSVQVSLRLDPGVSTPFQVSLS